MVVPSRRRGAAVHLKPVRGAPAPKGNGNDSPPACTIDTDGAGLTIVCVIKPELRAAADTELPPDLPAAGLGLLPGDGDGDGGTAGDEYIVTSGGLQGQRGFFTRDDSGAITGADLGGRLFTRTSARQ